MGRDDIRGGYYIRLWWRIYTGKVIYQEGRVTKTDKEGFCLKGKGFYEFVAWKDVVAYKLGRYG
ncbi:hypothetical protein H1164_17920 [Thermoactinomyces daqus]|uniref:Uncharacterized protein n=1 Tax=Thermoactinomyces daqus TaxID=1329516 RepID=A0A7W1XDN0_9BACL|nr:hypothetical protein [Thermoactinomyces daqus]MBA4544691.1 hypothetical protein [Thermoactinomyces daqus]